jgi:hypothetical protein
MRPFLMTLAVLAIAAQCWSVEPVSWADAQGLKVAQLTKAAEHAVAQQRTVSFPPQPLEANFTGVGGVSVEPSTAWDADGDGKSLKVTLKDIPENFNHVAVADRIQVRFPRPVNLLEKSTGFAIWIKADKDLSKDLRFGVHFKVEGTDQDPVVIADTPICQKFGDNPQRAYIDWGYVFDHSVGVFKVPPKEFFTKVTGFDLTIVQKRLPIEKGVKLASASGVFYIDGLQLVDFYDGSYDNERFTKGGAINAASPIVAQGRAQQVAHICVKYGGEAGIASALRAMDMMARTQCWEGSWPEMQTRLEGEWTHGMILADMSWAYAELKRLGRKELDETVKVRQWNMTRRALYEQMIYRAAMSRAPAPIHTFHDTYTSGEGALTGGCNRPMVFTISQYIAAGVLSDAAQKKQLLADYDLNMADLVASQGKTAGGWPIFGEGDRYGDKGLHWDCGYTTDHVFIMAFGSRVTGDKRWGDMMRKFDTVVTAMILPGGREIDGGPSERGEAKSGGLKAPDMVFQEATRWGAPALAQWGANESQHLWSHWPTGMWAYVASAKGYSLGAHLTWQIYDLQAQPAPADGGVVFPRQWPIWTARWMSKDGNEVRKSQLVVKPGGKMDNSFAWEVGQYPVVTGIPLAVTAEGGAVEIEAGTFRGSTAKLPDSADGRLVVLVIDADGKPRTVEHAMKDGKFTLPVAGATRVRLTFEQDKDIEIVFVVKPVSADAPATITCRLLRKPEPYEHTYVKANAGDK